MELEFYISTSCLKPIVARALLKAVWAEDAVVAGYRPFQFREDYLLLLSSRGDNNIDSFIEIDMSGLTTPAEYRNRLSRCISDLGHAAVAEYHTHPRTRAPSTPENHDGPTDDLTRLRLIERAVGRRFYGVILSGVEYYARKVPRHIPDHARGVAFYARCRRAVQNVDAPVQYRWLASTILSALDEPEPCSTSELLRPLVDEYAGRVEEYLIAYDADGRMIRLSSPIE
jgi:hypothetical protein